MRHIIAGIDPGTAIGIAILDLSGGKIATLSANNGIGEAVAIIEKYGTPSLIACDKMPAPEMVQKAASYFSCRLYVPPRNIREEEKRLIARGAGVENNHERDAYTAAVFGFRLYANKLRQIDALPDLQDGEKEKIKHLLLKGYRIRDAFASLGAEEDGEGARMIKGASPSTAHAPSREHVLSAVELKERVSSLARENANLRMLVARLEGEKRSLAGRMQLLENGVRQSVLRDSELRKVRHQLERSLLQLNFRRQKKRVRQPEAARKEAPEKSPAPQPAGYRISTEKKAQPEKPVGDNLNVDEGKLDIEKLVMEYRRGRNAGK